MQYIMTQRGVRIRALSVSRLVVLTLSSPVDRGAKWAALFNGRRELWVPTGSITRFFLRHEAHSGASTFTIERIESKSRTRYAANKLRDNGASKVH